MVCIGWIPPLSEIEPEKEPILSGSAANVTGAHMGHASDNTIQDVLIRYQRMRQLTLCYRGQIMPALPRKRVEAELAGRASPLGARRENFLIGSGEEAPAWRPTIVQPQRLGGPRSLPKRFTMDEGRSRAVREVFASLYERGLVYQKPY